MIKICAYSKCNNEFLVNGDEEKFRRTSDYCSNWHRKLALAEKNKIRYHEKVKKLKQQRKRFFL